MPFLDDFVAWLLRRDQEGTSDVETGGTVADVPVWTDTSAILPPASMFSFFSISAAPSNETPHLDDLPDSFLNFKPPNMMEMFPAELNFPNTTKPPESTYSGTTMMTPEFVEPPAKNQAGYTYGWRESQIPGNYDEIPHSGNHQETLEGLLFGSGSFVSEIKDDGLSPREKSRTFAQDLQDSQDSQGVGTEDMGHSGPASTPVV